MVMEDTSPILRKSMRDDVFDILHERIIAGQYAPGEWLRQEDISTQLGISMTPVREALDLIVSAGLAERIPYRGVKILTVLARNCQFLCHAPAFRKFSHLYCGIQHIDCTNINSE